MFGSGRRGGEGGEWNGFGLYQSCGNRGCVVRVSVFWLCRWGMGRGLDQGLEGWCYVCVSSESGFSVKMAGPGICVLCLADTCASEVHPVFHPVAPYGYMLPSMYLFIADITNSDSFV